MVDLYRGLLGVSSLRNLRSFEVGTHRISELYKDHQRRFGLTLKKHNTGEVAMFFFGDFQKNQHQQIPVKMQRYMYYMFFFRAGTMFEHIDNKSRIMFVFFPMDDVKGHHWS